MAMQYSWGFLHPSSIDFSLCSKLLLDCHIDLLGTSMSHRCSETFTGCVSPVHRFQAGCARLLAPTWSGTTVSFGLHPPHQQRQSPSINQSSSSSSSQLVIRRTWLSTVSDHALPVAGSRLCISQLPEVTSAPTLTVFQNRFKTYLFPNISFLTVFGFYFLFSVQYTM